MYITNY